MSLQTASAPPSRSLPTRAQVVVVGGGIIGCSVAYHLAHLGWTDVVVLWSGDRLTSGTTWHAAGLVVTFGSMSATSTEMRRYTRDLYARLEAETGLATGFTPVGFVELAADADRLEEYRRVAAFNRHCGVEVEEISPDEVPQLFPIARTDDLLAGFYVAGDGRANPVDVTMSLARGARMRASRSSKGSPSTGFLRRRGAVSGVRTRVRRHRSRVRRQLRRHVGPPARRDGRRDHSRSRPPSTTTSSRSRSPASRRSGPSSRTQPRTVTTARRSAG